MIILDSRGAAFQKPPQFSVDLHRFEACEETMRCLRCRDDITRDVSVPRDVIYFYTFSKFKFKVQFFGWLGQADQSKQIWFATSGRKSLLKVRCCYTTLCVVIHQALCIFFQRPETRDVSQQWSVFAQRGVRGDGGGVGMGVGRTWKREHHYSDTQLCALSTVWVMHLRAEAKYSKCFEMENNSAVAMELSEFESLR